MPTGPVPQTPSSGAAVSTSCARCLEHWQERRPWWRDALETVAAGAEVDGGPAAGAEPSGCPRRCPRAPGVAGRGQRRADGRQRVYDLGADLSPRQWRLLRVSD